MINYLYAIIFGAIQGITEFLPISSSGHLVILHHFIDLPINSELAFDVALHSATLLAIIIFFWKEIISLITSWIKSFKSGKTPESNLAWCIIIATIPGALCGYFFNSLIETYLRSVWLVVFMLTFIGVLLMLAEKIKNCNKNLNEIKKNDALIVGASQALALIPGVSRSGITIIAGMSRKINRENAIIFSFLIAAPITLGAVLEELPKLISQNTSQNEIHLIIPAFFAALITGVLTIKYFLRYAQRHTLNIFAYYRFFLAAIIILFLLLAN